MNGSPTRTPAQQADVIVTRVKGHAQKATASGQHIWRGLSKWERVIVVGALVALASVGLPWMSARSDTLWGWQVFLGSYLAVPVAIFVVLALIYFSQGSTSTSHVLRVRWILALSSFLLGVLLTYVVFMQAIMGTSGLFGGRLQFGIGIWAVFFALLAIIVGTINLQSDLLRSRHE